MNRGARGAVIALSVAALFGARGTLAEAGTHDGKDGDKKDAKVSCTGVNECKGKGQCASAGNSCGGSNECKGKGVMMMSAEECEKKGGKTAGK
jgi:hypothetical protein